MKLNVPESAARVIRRLEENGYEASCVGGCVRDALLGREPNDWDVTTSALPEKTLALFDGADGFRAIPTGMKHGTITILSCGEPIEVTTFRIDGVYTDGRRPDSVTFTPSLREDLARRDFTVNAMAYSPGIGLVDPFGGQNDLAAGVLRCVGEPEKRFGEDALRILRALRFSSVLGFEIEEKTARAAFALKDRLPAVSMERVAVELGKLLRGKKAAEVLREYGGILCAVLPELEGRELGLTSVTALNRTGASPTAVYAGFLRGFSPDEAFALLKRLRLDNHTCDGVKTILTERAVDFSSLPDVRLLCGRVGFDAARDIEDFLDAEGTLPAGARGLVGRIRETGMCVSVAGLAVNGRDLLVCGVKPAMVGETLKRLLVRVVNETVVNERETLLALVRAAESEDR